MSEERFEVGDEVVWNNKCKKGIVILTLGKASMVGVRTTELDLDTMKVGTSEITIDDNLIYVRTLSIEEMLTHTDIEVREAGLKKAGFINKSTEINITPYDL